MKNAFWVSFLTAWLIFSPAPNVAAQTTTPAERFFEVQLRIQHGDTIMGSPVIMTKSADEAFVSVNKPGGYAVRLMVQPDTAHPSPPGAQRLSMHAQIFVNDAGAWKKISSPQLSFLAGERVSMTSPAPSARGSALLQLAILATEIKAKKLTRISNPVKSCALWQELANEPLAGAHMPDFTYIAGGETCCSDTTNCEGGCCTALTQQG